MRSLTLVPIFLSAASQLVERLCTDLERILKTRVERRPPWFDPEAAFEPSRGQYDSSRFLELLLRGDDGGEKVLGVTNVDLFIPVLTYVFGEAQVDGRAAVVSLHRLRNEAWRNPVRGRVTTGRPACANLPPGGAVTGGEGLNQEDAP